MNKNRLLFIITNSSSHWAIFIRLSLGLVFFPEGIQKLIYPEALGAGRFLAIGIPYPEIMGPFVGWVEIICGSMILLGLFSRIASIPLIITMIVALISTKIPIYLGEDWWIFHVRELKTYGFWSFMHESRADFAMLLGACYLLMSGSGRWSLDFVIKSKIT